MSLVEKVKVICAEKVEELADTIEGELKAECPVATGEAKRAIHIEGLTPTRYRIGGKNLHLFFADQGNNQRLRIIYPKGKGNGGANALRFTDGSIHGSARTYEGKHFVKEVADRHR